MGKFDYIEHLNKFARMGWTHGDYCFCKHPSFAKEVEEGKQRMAQQLELENTAEKPLQASEPQ